MFSAYIDKNNELNYNVAVHHVHLNVKSYDKENECVKAQQRSPHPTVANSDPMMPSRVYGYSLCGWEGWHILSPLSATLTNG